MRLGPARRSPSKPAGAAARRARARRGAVVAPSRARGWGFTLIETAMTTVIIGVGVLALIQAQEAFLRSNRWSTQAATATYLANEVRELIRKLPRHDPVTGLYLSTSGGTTTLVGWGPEGGELSAEDFDDADDFDGLTFASNGTPSLADNDQPGPVDAFGAVIPEILSDGTIMLDSAGNPVPMQGWSQRVTVQKVLPFNPSQAVAKNYEMPAQPPNFLGLKVNQFPLRVTVEVLYQGPYDTSAQVVATVAWVIPN